MQRGGGEKNQWSLEQFRKIKCFGKELFVMDFAPYKLLDIYLCNMFMAVY